MSKDLVSLNSDEDVTTDSIRYKVNYTNLTTVPFYTTKDYEIDFKNVKSLSDVIFILKTLNLTIALEPKDAEEAEILGLIKLKK